VPCVLLVCFCGASYVAVAYCTPFHFRFSRCCLEQKAKVLACMAWWWWSTMDVSGQSDVDRVSSCSFGRQCADEREPCKEEGAACSTCLVYMRRRRYGEGRFHFREWARQSCGGPESEQRAIHHPPPHCQPCGLIEMPLPGKQYPVLRTIVFENGVLPPLFFLHGLAGDSVTTWFVVTIWAPPV
jgi:hypothetical protein